MIVNKTSNLTFSNTNTSGTKYKSDLDKDVKKIVTALGSRLRFGDGTDGANGENMAGQFQEFTSHASADTEFSVTHTIGSVPVGFITLWQDKAGSLYQSPTSGTDWTSDTIYLKCNGTSVTFKIFLLK